jgi:hypothetical protein
MKTNKKRLLFALALAFILIMAFTGCELIEEAKDKSSGNGGQGDTNTTPSTNYSWIMEPKLDYDEIYYHGPGICSDTSGVFYIDPTGSCWTISPETGEKIEDHIGHWDPTLRLGYDTKTKEYYELDYVDILIGNLKNELSDFDSAALFRIVDMDSRSSSGSKSAVANKDGLITDFIFDGVESNYNPILAVKQGNKWGFVDSSGKFFIEPIFDGAVSIDKDRAFVKQNGKWGIIRKGA